MKSESIEVIALRKAVENKFCEPLNTSNDFINLSNAILESCNETLSSSTLKRIWGYVKGYNKIRFYSLDILSKFAGYENFDSFIKDLDSKKEIYSNVILSENIKTNELQEGDKIKIGWLPNRECIIEYQNNDEFIVITSKNSKLKSGNTFTCTHFIKNEPLYINNLVQDIVEREPKMFVAGKKSGLTILEKIK